MPIPRRHLTAAVVVAVLASATAACGGGTEVAAGDVRAVDGSVDSATPLEVTVPTGTVMLEVGPPSDSVGDLSAPGGGRLIQVSTSFADGEVRKDVWNLAARGGAVKPVTLAMTVGDDDYPVGTLRRGSDPGAAGSDVLPRTFVVAVDQDVDDLDDVTFEVGYDGLDQTVHAADGSRDPGPADALYDDGTDPAGAATTDCRGGTTRPALELQLDCTVGPVSQVPYVPGAGWADEGRTWTVVALAAAARSATDGDATYTATDSSSRTTLDGVAPQTVLDESKQMGGASYTAQLVFDSEPDPTAPLQVSMTWALALTSGGGAPSARELDYTKDVDLSDLES